MNLASGIVSTHALAPAADAYTVTPVTAPASRSTSRSRSVTSSGTASSEGRWAIANDAPPRPET